MRNLMLLVVCCSSALSLYAQTPSVDALRTYAEEKGIPPKEYIFKLFENRI